MELVKRWWSSPDQPQDEEEEARVGECAMSRARQEEEEELLASSFQQTWTYDDDEEEPVEHDDEEHQQQPVIRSSENEYSYEEQTLYSSSSSSSRTCYDEWSRVATVGVAVAAFVAARLSLFVRNFARDLPAAPLFSLVAFSAGAGFVPTLRVLRTGLVLSPPPLDALQSIAASAALGLGVEEPVIAALCWTCLRPQLAPWLDDWSALRLARVAAVGACAGFFGCVAAALVVVVVVVSADAAPIAAAAVVAGIAKPSWNLVVCGALGALSAAHARVIARLPGTTRRSVVVLVAALRFALLANLENNIARAVVVSASAGLVRGRAAGGLIAPAARAGALAARGACALAGLEAKSFARAGGAATAAAAVGAGLELPLALAFCQDQDDLAPVLVAVAVAVAFAGGSGAYDDAFQPRYLDDVLPAEVPVLPRVASYPQLRDALLTEARAFVVIAEDGMPVGTLRRGVACVLVTAESFDVSATRAFDRLKLPPAKGPVDGTLDLRPHASPALLVFNDDPIQVTARRVLALDLAYAVVLERHTKTVRGLLERRRLFSFPRADL